MKQIRIYFLFDPKLKIDLGKILNKNLLVENRLINSAYKIAKSIIETNSKIQKLKTYNKVINNLIHRSK